MEKEDIIWVDTKRPDVKVWLIISREETLLCVAIAVSAKDSKTTNKFAEEIKNREMLVLRKEGYELAREAEVTEEEIECMECKVAKYTFRWSEWKKTVMKK